MSYEQTLKQARRNIKLVVLVATLTKRSYIPLSAIYFVQVSGLSIPDIGQVAALFALVMLVSDLPTGYLADRIGRPTCIRLGAVLALVGLGFYVLLQNKLGVMTGVVFEGMAYGFLAGAGPALMHDSLEVTDEVKRYSKIMSRTQAVSLLINAALVVLVPLTYPIDPRLPFVIGMVAFVALFVTGLFMRDVRPHQPQGLRLPAVRAALKHRPLLAFLAVLGVVGAVYAGPSDLFNLALNDFGMRPEYLGWFFAGASLLGAALGMGIHRLKELPMTAYAALDVLVVAGLLVAAFSGSVILFGTAFMLGFAFWRYRHIMYQHYILELYPTRYKGTLYALLNSVEQANQVWVPVVIAGLAAQVGLARGLGISGLAMLVLLPIMVWVTSWMVRDRARRLGAQE